LLKQKLKKMKKIVLVALTLFVAGTMYADKKCCKDKASCANKTETKACSKDAPGGKSCCKKGGETHAAVNADGTVAATATGTSHCAKGTTGKSCCQNKNVSVAPAQDAKPAQTK
jgi:hypothetical protein